MTRYKLYASLGLLLVVLLCVVGGLAIMLRHEKAFYARVAVPAGPKRQEESTHCLNTFAKVVTTDIMDRNPDDWEEHFSETELNSYFAEDFTAVSEQLLPDDVVLGIVRDRLAEADCQAGCLLDGFPRTTGQAEGLDQFLAVHKMPLDGAVEMRVDEEELANRMLARGRSDDKPEVIRDRLATYRAATEPLVEYYRRRRMLETIDALGSIDEVFGRLKSAIGRLARK